MKNVKICYKDKNLPDQEFETRSYPPDTAEQMAEILSKMGCHEFRYVPEKEERSVLL